MPLGICSVDIPEGMLFLFIVQYVKRHCARFLSVHAQDLALCHWGPVAGARKRHLAPHDVRRKMMQDMSWSRRAVPEKRTILDLLALHVYN